MSRNSTQIIRQWRILSALEATRHGLTVAELHDAVDEDCDQRTIYRDLVALESAGFPLQRDETTSRWRILEPREGGWVVPLDPTELIALAMSESLLESTEVALLLEPLRDLRAKLLAMMTPRGRSYFEELRTASIATLKAPTTYAEKAEVLSALQEAIQEREAVRIHHQKPTDPSPKARVIEPYATWFTEGGFYVIAFCRSANDYRHFALQRIHQVDRLDESFEPSPLFDAAAYSRRGFGAYHGAVTRVALRFSPELAFLARERRFHHTQRLTPHPDGTMDLFMEAAGLPEIASWVAGFGGRVVPLSPPELVDAVRELFVRGLSTLSPAAGQGG